MASDQKAAPPGRAASEVASSRARVVWPRATRAGAKRPFIVACAVMAKTAITVKARRFPDPSRTVRRETQPRVRTMPAPNSSPPSAMASTGRSGARNLCPSNEMRPSATAPCVPTSAVASAASQTPAADRRSTGSPVTARRRQKRVTSARAPKATPRSIPRPSAACWGVTGRFRDSNMAAPAVSRLAHMPFGRQASSLRQFPARRSGRTTLPVGLVWQNHVSAWRPRAHDCL